METLKVPFSYLLLIRKLVYYAIAKELYLFDRGFLIKEVNL